MGLVIALGVIIICVIYLYLVSKKSVQSDDGSQENCGDNNFENNEDKNAYNIQRMADDIHFIKTVVLVYVILSFIGVFIVICNFM